MLRSKFLFCRIESSNFTGTDERARLTLRAQSPQEGRPLVGGPAGSFLAGWRAWAWATRSKHSPESGHSTSVPEQF